MAEHHCKSELNDSFFRSSRRSRGLLEIISSRLIARPTATSARAFQSELSQAAKSWFTALRGCTFAEILEAVGLLVFRGVRIIDEYVYRDKHGKALYSVFRGRAANAVETLGLAQKVERDSRPPSRSSSNLSGGIREARGCGRELNEDN
jgi:hypothetical protein